MRYSLTLAGALAFALHASAYPFVLDSLSDDLSNVEARAKKPAPGSKLAKKLSAARGNCGVVPCTTFDEKAQYVSTHGEHAFKAPSTADIRGPCPGLNAAANHGYISRNGISNVEDTVVGLMTAYGMAADLGGFLAAFSILIDGDPVAGTWSIGGPLPTNPLTKGILGQGQGISYSHNKYEGDSSIGRADAYLNNGDAHSLLVDRFISAYDATSSNDRYSLDSFAQNFLFKSDESVKNNPYYVSAPFSGLVAPAAYNFIINFMSNHTAEEPSGYFDKEMFKTFFAVTGEYPNFKWKKGHEKIPENWYKRPDSNQYSIAGVFADLGPQFLAYPSSLRFGGNTGTKDSFIGVDLGQLTGGNFNQGNILDGNNLACLFAEFAQAGIPDAAQMPLKLGSAITGLIQKNIAPVISGLECPGTKFDVSVFGKYPGYKYNPKGPATNYL